MASFAKVAYEKDGAEKADVVTRENEPGGRAAHVELFLQRRYLGHDVHVQRLRYQRREAEYYRKGQDVVEDLEKARPTGPESA